MDVLIVVDMQSDFIDAALGTAEALAIVPAVAEKIRRFHGAIFTTQDTHQADYLQTQEGRNLPIAHCIADSEGWALHETIAQALDEKRAQGLDVQAFQKPSFGSLALAEHLTQLHKREHIDEITLVGLCTDICVISNALLLKAFLPEVPITVDSACCAGVTPESHQTALAAMQACQIKIM